ncbi:hypothetical protein HPO96_36965 [Kribbella sandramycini]|uniref:Uncharacterized protein n=1 Tax=Kribbella sandramycini TaxID=60450 RepID=A0A7Y4L9I6_9ACTN|nr:hypothetical protein [Kribbella sandramycini]MBB6564388.1 hypothetical protein [Kribbella sandramycini]NOL45851.1 hypothetical protein [Kribbella sandramycini]
MALPALSTVAAMEVRMGLEVGSLSGADLARAQTSLDDASTLIRTVAKRNWVDAGGSLDDVPDVVATICTRAAIRDYRNPDGVSNEALGQGAYSYTYAEGQSTIYLTEDEVDLIREAANAPDPENPNAWTGTGSIRTPAATDNRDGLATYGGWPDDWAHWGGYRGRW